MTSRTPPSVSGSNGKTVDQDLARVWAAYAEHKPRARLLPDRRDLIARRLKQGWSADELVAAIEGCFASDFHQGRNDRGRKYDSIELILRNTGKIEQFIELAENPPRRPDRAAELMKEGILEDRAGQADPRSGDGRLPGSVVAAEHREPLGLPARAGADQGLGGVG